MKHKFKYHNKHSINVKWSSIWVIIHSISLFIIGFLLDYIKIQSEFIQLLLLGFGITILARIAKIFTAKKRFIVDKWFIFWSLLNAFTIWLGYLIINWIGLTNPFWNTVLLAVLLVLIANIIRRFRLPNTRLIILSIVIIAILFFATNEQSDNYFNKITSPEVENIDNTKSDSSDYKDKISDITENIKVKVDEIAEDIDPKSYKNIQEAFEELNEIRAEHGLSKLGWDDNIYELVRFQASKGLCSTSHCDHMDSSEKYFDAYASRFGVSLMGHSAENIAGSDCHQAVVDLWLHSTTGHKENMLNPVMHKGALAYDKGNCILIVTS
jgi:uncharacterized protein YkwD